MLPPQGPVLLCTTSDALPDVWGALPASRRADAVFMTNGMLPKFFAQNKIVEATQVLLYMSGAPLQALWSLSGT